MPNPNLSLVAVVLDRSGSMESLREATLEGLNTFLDVQRKNPGDTLIHLVQFDDQYEIHCDFADLKRVSLSKEDYEPRGGTALYDAIGRTVNEVGNRLAAMPEATRPGKVVFVIQTDGFENASREFKQAQVFDMIAHQRTNYQWEFVFLGANQDAMATGAKLGVGAHNSMTYNSSAISTRKAFTVASNAIANYVSNGTKVEATMDSYRGYVSDDTQAEDPTLTGTTVDNADVVTTENKVTP